MMDTLQKMVNRKNMVGSSLVLVGAVVGFGANLGVLNRVLFSFPGLGDVTPVRIMGLVTLGLGVAVLTKFDPLDLQEAV
tara:strand:- start:341 stop:577 length:237 start_codon:yes stop_codon:yes gene_type:complete